MNSTNNEFDFVYLSYKKSPLEKKDVQEKLMKWSMKSMRIDYFNFNQPFKFHQKQTFAECFFRSPVIYMNLPVLRNGSWGAIGEPADTVNIEVVPCSVTSMGFFDCITDPKFGIVRPDQNTIIQMFEEEIESFYVGDKLRQCVLESSSESKGPFNESQKQQFIFKILKHLALGGQWCQHDDVIEPYLDLTKHLYKELVSVERSGDNEELSIRSLVLKVVAYASNRPIAPVEPNHKQNFLYMIIDPFKRQVATMLHQYNAPFVV